MCKIFRHLFFLYLNYIILPYKIQYIGCLVLCKKKKKNSSYCDLRNSFLLSFSFFFIFKKKTLPLLIRKLSPLFFRYFFRYFSVFCGYLFFLGGKEMFLIEKEVWHKNIFEFCVIFLCFLK